MTVVRTAVAMVGMLALATACAPGSRAPAAAWDATGSTLVVPPGLTGRTVLRGVLIDSLVTNDTLRGALVSVEGREGSVLTDAHGAFVLDSVARGARRLLVRHPVLDSIGVTTLPVPLVVTDSTRRSVWLPTPELFLGAVCKPTRQGGTGALLGTVRRASDDSPLAGVEVIGAWRSSDSSFAGSGTRPRARVRTDADGHFVLCEVPRFSPVELWSAAHADDAAHVRVQLGARVLAGYDLSVDPVAPARDSVPRAAAPRAVAPRADIRPARVAGRILTLAGDGLPNVTVSIDRPVRRTVTDATGRFVIDSVPAGIRTLEVRAIGFQPQRLGVSVRPGEQVDRDITIDRNLAVLGTFVVRASRTAAWDSAGFEERRKKGTGYFFERETLAGVNDLSTALRMVPGIRGRSSDRSQRLVAGRGTGCFPAFVVNRVRFDAGGAIGPEAMIRAQDIRAMEVYTSRLSTPPEHQRYGDCAVIVIWLRDPQAEIEARKK
jgi:hypothetical protein